MTYDESYYKTANYTDYLSRKERYIHLASELIDLLKKISKIDADSRILDYGCATGFLLEGFKQAGYQHAFGYDISEWAANEARKSGHKVLERPDDYDHLDIMFALDVLEHMNDYEIRDLMINKLGNRQWPNVVVTRIPCSVDGKDFHLPISRKDPTHINCKTKEQWISFFESMNYKSHVDLNLFTIYDSPGVACQVFWW